MRSSDNVDAGIGPEFFDKPINQARIDQWFIALDVKDERELFRVACNLGYAIGAAAVFYRSQCDLGTPFERGLSNSHVIGCDDDQVQIFGSHGSFPDAPQKRFSSNYMQRFSRKTCRTPARWNDAHGPVHETHSNPTATKSTNAIELTFATELKPWRC